LRPQPDADFKNKYLRQLPSMGKLLEHPALKSRLSDLPHVLVLQAAQTVVEERKKKILSAKAENELEEIDLSIDDIAEEATSLAAKKSMMSLRGAINATGDVLNENLGRAPMNDYAQRAIQDVAKGYSTLAVNTETGGYVDRNVHVQNLLSTLTGAETGLVLNNNAAAVMLILNTLCKDKGVIISRGQLVENDGFRLPDIISKSDAHIIPVGTTNKTHLSDYSEAIGENTGAIMRVHITNYRIAGFFQDVSIHEIAKLGKKHGVPVIDDIGSGCMVDLTQYNLPEELPISVSVKAGADIVCFSGDKFLGGSQAGVVVGSRKCIEPMMKNPLYRVLRAGKLIIAALEATLRSHLDTGNILKANPVLRMFTKPLSEIESAAICLVEMLKEKISGIAEISIEDGYSEMKSFAAEPGKFPTKIVCIKPKNMSAEMLAKRLRSGIVPIFVGMDNHRVLMDLRTVERESLDEIAVALLEC
jgi:L-seryl-tRNA(Ser) seleniumtransferase